MTTASAIKPFALLLAALGMLPMVAHAQGDDVCIRQFKVERDRIEREMTRQVPPKGDRDAEMQWSKKLHAALELAGNNAERCRERNTPKLSAAEVAAVENCLTRNLRAGDEIQKRYSGRTLSFAEQTALRGEETRLIDDRRACMIKPR
ncbi:MAG: hypothetical protein V4614_08450 [Pseudomonadota bacterium]